MGVDKGNGERVWVKRFEILTDLASLNTDSMHACFLFFIFICFLLLVFFFFVWSFFFVWCFLLPVLGMWMCENFYVFFSLV